MFDNEMYWNSVGKRSPQKVLDRGWRCLCCKDSGIVDDLLLRSHYPGPDWQPSGIANRCQRPGCGEGAKYPGYALARDVSPKICQWLHDQDFAAKAEAPDPSEVIAAVREGVEQIKRSMPNSSQRDFSGDPILATTHDDF